MKLLIKNLNIDYNNICILQEINLIFEKKQIYFLTGANGEGKSALLKCISSVKIPTIGEIYLNDNETIYDYKKNEDLKYIRNNICAMLNGHESLYYNLTCTQNIIYFLSIKKINYNKDKFEYYLNLFNIEQYQNTMVYKLSTGTKQKIILIITMLSDLNILIFDEPTIGLDKLSINVFKDEIKRLKMDKIIIVATHEELLINDISDKIIYLKNKKIENSEKYKQKQSLYNSVE